MDCPACGHANRASARFCAACGRELAASPPPPETRQCAACGSACPATAHFCPSCGSALEAAAAEVPDFSAVRLEPPARDDAGDRTVILPASPRPPASAGGTDAAPPPGAGADMTVVLPAGWRQAPAAHVPPPDDVTVIPDRPAAAPPPPPPPAAPQTPATGGHGRGRQLLLGAVLALAASIAIGIWYGLTAPSPLINPNPATNETAATSPPASTPADTADAAPTPGDGGSASPAPLAASPTQDVATPPAPVTVQSASAGPRPVRVLYLEACARCHDRGEGGSPRVGAPDQWSGLLKRSHAALADQVLKGHGGAPARGGVGLDDTEARRLVAHLAQLVEQNAQRLDAERARAAQAAPPATAPAAPAPAPAPRPDDWLTSLRGELAQCARLNFFARVPCEEKARWRYCNNRWNTVAECTLRNQTNPQ